MALIPCPYCGSNISSNAKKCPKCGNLISAANEDDSFSEQDNSQSNKPYRWIRIFGVIVLFIAILGLAYYLYYTTYIKDEGQGSSPITEQDLQASSTSPIDDDGQLIPVDNMKFDKVSVLNRPNSTYIIQGGRYETRINIGSYDSRAKFEAEVNGQRLRSDENGTVIYTAAATTPGEKRVHAKIYVKNDNGPAETYEFDDTYFVAEPVAVVSLTKMNVVYAGIDNPVSISVPGIDSHLINVSIPGGGATISKDPAGKAGDYIIRASKLGKITVYVDAKTDGNTMRIMGNMEIRVKKIPKPVLIIGNFKSGDVVTKDELLAIGQIHAAMEDFDFQLPTLSIASFDFNVSGSQKKDITGTGRTLNSEMKSMLNNAKHGDEVIIKNMTVKTPDGVTHNLCATFRIK